MEGCNAGAGLASKAWTTSSSQLQLVRSSRNPTTTSLVLLSTNSTWKWASPERCHRGKHVCALRWHVHSHSDLHSGHAGHIESLFLSLDLLTGMMLNRKHPFWRQVPVVKKVFQCDPSVTPESIRAGQTAAAEAVEAFFSGTLGVPVLSPHNSMMSLHSLLDREIEVNGRFVHL